MKDSASDADPPRLRINSLRDKLHANNFVVGTFLEIPAPALVELLGLAGFDFVVVDREHGPIDDGQTQALIRAGLSTAVSVVVRTPNCEPTHISKALDFGATGVQVPQIESQDMARATVRASKYHPEGARGLQPYVRSASYRSYPTADYLANANRETLVVVQVEGSKGIANLDAILKVEGVDIAFIGPYDLSQSLGIPGQVKHPRVQEALNEAVRLAQKAGKHIGTYCDDVETALEYRSAGVTYLTVSIDAYIFLSNARSMISRLKN